MVQIAALSIAVTAALFPLVMAKNCTPGLNYCGSTLQRIAQENNYDHQIKEQLRYHGKELNEKNIRQSLFYCTGGPDGEIFFRRVCDDGSDDYCANNGPGNTGFAAASQHVDVAIVGGGLSGLSAARDLAAAGKTFTILEARSRVGGRVLNAKTGSSGVQEVGAEYVGPTQDRVLALAASLGLKTYKTFDDGNTTVLRNGSVTSFLPDPATGGLLPLSPEASAQVMPVIEELSKLAAEIPVNSPWDHPSAEEWDRMTCDSYLRSRLNNSDALFVFDLIFDAVLSTTASEPSLLYWLSYIASAGNSTMPGSLGRLLTTSDGAQERRIVGGTALLATKLAERLGLKNIRLNAPVHRIVQSNKTYTVYWDDKALTADYVVIAMSPPLAGRITHEPALPARRDQLTQRMPMSSIGKAIAIYPKPFWRKQGVNGQALGDSGITRATFDNSPSDGSYGAIMGFIGADSMRSSDLLEENKVKELYVADLVKFFGPEAANTTDFILQRWDLEPYSRGGPVAYGPPGLLTKFGPFLRKPFGNIHFAGTETADYWVGYMDGAIRSGERVAQEILRKMPKTRSG
ncbi:hypothetical protein CP533_1089 [Ophiocordyceps camponoti-saundersi (nom. inval.)]|nr:hypothetical protein CP533_1089 [Ophiocordyceps camponoti-saundersi (nom. inval.)]